MGPKNSVLDRGTCGRHLAYTIEQSKMTAMVAIATITAIIITHAQTNES